MKGKTMKKLQEFARECGVTDRAIQKHLKNHENELKGHFLRKGKNGTWLDEFAQEYIRQRMTIKAVAVADNEMINEIEELRNKVKELEDKIERKDIIIESQQQREYEKDKLLAEAAKNQLLLEERTEEIKELKDALKEAREDAEYKVKESNQRAFQAEQKVKEQQSELDKFEKTLFGLYKKKS